MLHAIETGNTKQHKNIPPPYASGSLSMLNLLSLMYLRAAKSRQRVQMCEPCFSSVRRRIKAQGEGRAHDGDPGNLADAALQVLRCQSQRNMQQV